MEEELIDITLNYEGQDVHNIRVDLETANQLLNGENFSSGSGEMVHKYVPFLGSDAVNQYLEQILKDPHHSENLSDSNLQCLNTATI
jgi:hypothetical protein